MIREVQVTQGVPKGEIIHPNAFDHQVGKLIPFTHALYKTVARIKAVKVAESGKSATLTLQWDTCGECEL